MASIFDWSVTAADNDDADTDINWLEGQAGSSVNNSARAMMAKVAALVKAMRGAYTTTNSGNNYTVAVDFEPSALSKGWCGWIRFNAANTGASTLQIGALTSANLKDAKGNALASGFISANSVWPVIYDTVAGEYRLLGIVGFDGSLTGTLSVSGNIELGHASDTTLARVSAGVVSIEGKNIVLNDSSVTVTLGGIELGHASDTSITRVSAGVIAVEGKNVALNGTSEVLTTGTIELGNASDTTLSRSSAGRVAVEGSDLAFTTETQRATQNAQTGTTYTAVAGDKGKVVTLSNASAITVTINNSVHAAGDRIDFVQYGAGQVTFAAGAGFTLRSSGSKLKLTGQYSGATIWFISASEGILIGDITS